MKYADMTNLVDLYSNGIKIYKDMCNHILKDDSEYSEELFLLLLAVSDSLESLGILAKFNKARDCYVISRVIYETIINTIYISATKFKAMDEMIEYTKKKTEYESSRSISTDSETLFLLFDGKQHTVGFTKNNPINMKGDPREWAKKENSKPMTLKDRINYIESKYDKVVSRSLKLAHLTIYRTSSDIAHGTLYGMKHAMGLIHGKNLDTFTAESMIEHNFNVISTMLVTISQSLYSLIFALNEELSLEVYERNFYKHLSVLIKNGSNSISSDKKRENK